MERLKSLQAASAGLPRPLIRCSGMRHRQQKPIGIKASSIWMLGGRNGLKFAPPRQANTSTILRQRARAALCLTSGGGSRDEGRELLTPASESLRGVREFPAVFKARPGGARSPQRLLFLLVLTSHCGALSLPRFRRHTTPRRGRRFLPPHPAASR